MVGELTGGVCEGYMEKMQTDSFQFDGGAGGTSVKYIDATRVSVLGQVVVELG
jgi:hypothetical protein